MVFASPLFFNSGRIVFWENICYHELMKFTAVYKKHKNWYLGWVEEIPGVNTQGKTLKEVKENLREALDLIFEANRIISKRITRNSGVIREQISPLTG